MLMKNFLFLLLATFLFAKTWAQADSTASSLVSLPVFEVQAVDNLVVLKWSVEQSEEYKSFEIERAEKDQPYQKVGSKLSISKSSQSLYDFVDATPRHHVALRYRLKLIAKDGSIFFTDFREALVGDSQCLLRLKQNPVHSSLEVDISLRLAQPVKLVIVSQAGQPVLSQTVRLSAGANPLSVPLQSLLQGVYQLVVEAGTERKIISFIKE